MDIVTALNRHINHGNNSEKYPLEVIFGLHGEVSVVAGATIPTFSVGFSVGFATAQAGLLFAIGLHEVCKDAGVQVKEMDNFATVALNLLKVLRMRFVYQPAASLADQVNKSIAAKMAASERQRPIDLQLTVAFGRIVDNLAPSARKSRSDLFEPQGPEGWRLQDLFRRAGMIRLRFLKVLRKQWSR